MKALVAGIQVGSVFTCHAPTGSPMGTQGAQARESAFAIRTAFM